MIDHFPLINVRHQITDLVISEHQAGQIPKTPNKLHLGMLFTNYRKSKIKKKIQKEAKG